MPVQHSCFDALANISPVTASSSTRMGCWPQFGFRYLQIKNNRVMSNQGPHHPVANSKPSRHGAAVEDEGQSEGQDLS
jgi:hypothetical protein